MDCGMMCDSMDVWYCVIIMTSLPFKRSFGMANKPVSFELEIKTNGLILRLKFLNTDYPGNDTQ